MNDVIKGALELRDEQGNFHKHYFETSADMVKCDDSGTTVADILSNISATTAAFADETGSAEKDSDGNVISTTYAPINSPNFTGVPTAPTAENLDLLTNQVATVAWANNVFKRFTGIVPENMDTLQEFWAALGQDSDLSTTLATELNKKLDSDTVLTSISNLTLTADKTLYTSADNVFSTTDLTSKARQILAASNAAAARKALGVNRATIYDECPVNWRMSGSPGVSNGKISFGGAGYAKRSLTITLGGSNPFTIETLATANEDTTSVGRSFVFLYANANNNIRLNVRNNVPRLALTQGGTDNFWDGSANIYGNERHLALSYDGTTVRAFVDGVLVGSAAQVLAEQSYQVYLSFNSPDVTYLKSTLDEFRISDVCRYTADFTPVTRHELDEHTLTLLHFDD